MSAGSGASRRLFYGYWILACVFVVQMLVNGCGMYAFSLFVKPLQTAFGWSRAGIMFSLVLYNLVTAATSPLVGRVVDRLGSRAVMAAGTVVMGVGLLILSRAGQLWQYNLVWGLIGAGVCATGFIPTTALLFKWFRRRRGFAIGVMGTGIGLGGFLMSPLVGSWLIPHLGWRLALVVLGTIVIGVCTPLTLLVIKPDPATVGQQVDGDPAPGSRQAAAVAVRDSRDRRRSRGAGQPDTGVTAAQALRSVAFWLMAPALALFGFAMNAIFQNQVPHLQDLGFSAATAATALSMVGIGSAVGKLAFGLACDWLRPRYVFIFGILLQLVSVVILVSITIDSPQSLVLLYAVLYGAGIGCWPIISMLVSDTFGLAYYGTIYGMLNFTQMIGSSLGAPFAGLVQDATGSYRLAFIVFIAAYAVVIPAVMLSGRFARSLMDKQTAGQ